MTVISIIALPGIFGMNVELPIDERLPRSFLLLFDLILSFTVLMLLYFRHRKWL